MLMHQDEQRLAAVTAAAEKKTGGEIVVVWKDASDSYTNTRAMLAMFLGVIAAALVFALSRSVGAAACSGVFGAIAGGFGLGSWPGVRRFFTKDSTLQEAVEERMEQSIYQHGLDCTKQRNAILIYVSEFERRVGLWADEGIHQKLGKDQWALHQKTIAKGLREGTGVDTIIRVVEILGGLLAQHYPKTADDKNELPDTPLK